MEQNSSLLHASKQFCTTETLNIMELVNWEPEEISEKVRNMSPEQVLALESSDCDFLHFDLGSTNEVSHLTFQNGESVLLKKFQMEIIWSEKLIYSILNQKLHLDHHVGAFNPQQVKEQLQLSIAKGMTRSCDLLVRDIYPRHCSFLPLNLLASSLGKVNKGTAPESGLTQAKEQSQINVHDFMKSLVQIFAVALSNQIVHFLNLMAKLGKPDVVVLLTTELFQANSLFQVLITSIVDLLMKPVDSAPAYKIVFSN